MILEEILKKLVAFQTVSLDHKENERCLRWIKKQSEKCKVFTKLIRVNSFPSLLITTKKTKTPILWLSAHIDVVPGSPAAFIPKRKGGRLFGRGTSDMKFAAACYIKLLKDLEKNLQKYNFGIMLTSDEELGGEHGVRYLVDQGYRSRVVFIPDGGLDWKIEKGAKGVLSVEIISRGISAHGSQTWLGKNAITLLMDFLTEIRTLFVKDPCRDESHWHATCNIGKIEGGKAANQIPDFAKALLNIRTISEPRKRALLKKIRHLQKRFSSIQIKIINNTPSFRNNFKLSFARTFLEIARKKYGIETGFTMSHGTSDARFFVQKKIPAISTRPHGGGLHSENEWVDINDLGRFYSVLKDFVVKISKLE